MWRVWKTTVWGYVLPFWMGPDIIDGFSGSFLCQKAQVFPFPGWHPADVSQSAEMTRWEMVKGDHHRIAEQGIIIGELAENVMNHIHE
ncbi:hypothetical protein HFU84_12505, partial [Acidithiobacillus sp. CV18-2]|nr:hypothetical protein [Acidithiobacillus sp. CV18-2]